MHYKITNLIKFFRPKSISLLSLFFIALLNVSFVHSENDIVAKEYALKTAFLYNFARLVDWPEGTLSNGTPYLQICLIGNDPFDRALKALNNKKAHNKTLLINRNISAFEIPQCQILFISESETENVTDILKTAAQSPILTISELEGFTQQSGHIRLFLREDKTISLEVNHNAIKKSGLAISSRILSLAKIIETEEQNHD